MSRDGKRLWVTKFANTSENRSDQDIWSSVKTNNEWVRPTNDLPGLNSEFNDLVIGKSDGDMVYTLRYSQDVGDQLTTFYAYQGNSGTYKLHHEVHIPKIKLESEFFGFFIPEDESYILISMQGEFSFGKEDIYVLLKKNGQWTEPIHLGARINSAGFEMSPYMAPDGKHLFFASEGHNSYGSGDIFVSVRLDDTWQAWSKPTNLGPNINSAQFEAYFTLNPIDNEAYFISNAGQKPGSLYRVDYGVSSEEANMAHQSASGFIRMEKLPAMNVKLNLLDENDQVVQSITTNDDGFFNLQSFLPDRDYKIAIDDSVRQDLSTADIFLTNDLGEKMVFMNEDELGLFGFKVLSGKKISEVSEFEKLASSGGVVDKPATISGKVATYGTLKEKVKLNVVNEKSEVVSQIVTDENGYFEFSTDAHEKSYFLSVDEDVQGLVDVYEIFLTNDNPGEDIMVSKTDKHLFEFRTLSDGSNDGLARLVEHDRAISRNIVDRYGYQPSSRRDGLMGYVKTGKLPLIDAEISLIDEDEHLIQKTTTNEEGKFVFDERIDQGDYTLQLSEEQDESLDPAEIYLARNPEDVMFYLDNDKAGVFAFKKLAKARPMTLYSLRTEAEEGRVVTNQPTSLKGRFSYDKLPKSGVTLKLMDEYENVVQITEVDETGRFEFKNYSVNKNYFIAVDENHGLSDIYEVYLGGGSQNVLVNNTNQYVFAFTILPSRAIMLTKAYEHDVQMDGTDGEPMPEINSAIGDIDKTFFEFDVKQLELNGYKALSSVVDPSIAGKKVTIRVYQATSEDGDIHLHILNRDSIAPIIEKLVELGISRSAISYGANASDQYIITIKE